MKRIVITGLGAITPIGNDAESFWTNLLAGKSGVGKLTQFDPDGMPYNMACEVRDFDPQDYMARKLARRTARTTQFAIAASKQALADSGFEITPENAENVGVLMATGGGGINEIEYATKVMVQKSWRSVGPFVVPSAMANAVSCLASMETGAKGPVMTSTAACASGHYSILEAYHFLQRGEAELIVAGGTESTFSMLTMAAFGNMGPLSKRTDDPEHACRPFSVDRDGFVSGEGAVAMTLESEEHAKARGAYIYAEVLGGALTGDAYHVTAPDPSGEGAVRAIRRALQYAGLTNHDVDLVLAHGTGTHLNDQVEALALRTVFGAEGGRMPKVTSIKSMLGHALGAAGAQSALAAVRALETGMAPPTINYTPDPELGVDIVGNKAQRLDPRIALVEAFGFGGQNVVVAFKKWEG